MGAVGDRRPPVRVLVAVGLVAGSTLALQVLLTRVFAAVLYYHFGFMAISLALLGVGAGAILIYVRPQWFDSDPLERALARWSVLYAGLLIVAVLLIVRLDYTLGDEVTTQFVFNLAAACVLAAMPFLAAGIVISLAVRGYARSIGRVYAFDLAGAGLGAAVVVPLMWAFDAPTLLVALGVVAALAAILFAAGLRSESMLTGGALGVSLVFLALAGTTSIVYLNPLGQEPETERWTPLGRVLGYLPGPELRNGNVVYDRNFGEIIPYKRGEPLPDWRPLQEGPQSIGYALTPGGDSVVIGGGGGRDVLTALTSGSRHVDVVELNRGIRDTVDKKLRFFSGGPYSLPRVSTHIADGRSYVAESDKKFDQIQIGYVDTFSPSGAQAFALTEHNLYTVEAFDEFFDHLKRGGVLNLARPVEHNGEEALRATVLTLDALKRHGVENPERNVVVILADYVTPFRGFEYGTILAKLEPFTPAELAKIKRLAETRSLKGIAMAPGGPYQRQWAQLHEASSPIAFCENYHLDVCPPTDDKPFFFNMKRLRDVGGASTTGSLGVPDPVLVLLITLAILLGLSAIAFALPLALVGREGRPNLGSLGFFAAIGLGFLVLEVALIQRFVLFLGFPTYALSVVLFALLVFTGIGSLLSSGSATPRRTLMTALSVACVLIAASAYGLEPLLRELIGLPFAVRLILTVVMLAPLGLTLGMAMPLGLIRLQGLYPGGVPWAWGINGIASVVASVLAIFTAINWGFAITTLIALVFYLGALAHAAFGRWPDDGTIAEADPEPDPARVTQAVA
jgi:hypothetical protein